MKLQNSQDRKQSVDGEVKCSNVFGLISFFWSRNTGAICVSYARGLSLPPTSQTTPFVLNCNIGILKRGVSDEMYLR